MKTIKVASLPEIFAEWQTRYVAEPTNFARADVELLNAIENPRTIQEAAHDRAAYFIQLAKEL